MKPFDISEAFDYRAIVDHKPFHWPNGARVAVWVIPNIEYYRLEFTQPILPNIRHVSRTDYGNRVGIWRLMEAMDKYGIRGSVALNGEVVQRIPRIMEAAVGLNWELMGHGMTNSIHLTSLEEEEERKVILDTRDSIAQMGQKMRGWLGPGLTESWNSLSLLKEAGVEYVCDWVNDDLPYRMNNGLHSIPYSIELNDMPLFNMPSISVDDFERRIKDTFDVLYEEGETCGRVLGIALHPFLIGVPHRIKYLERAFAYLASFDKVWFATGSEIISYYAQHADENAAETVS
jgi:peptidoglycan/xylan/chitin deacetylase (PgdA/CDA1 family)